MNKSLIVACSLLAATLTAPVQADTAAERYFLQELGQQVLLPRYLAVANSSQALAASVEQLCRTPGGRVRNESRQHWQHAYLQWLAVSALNWGPSAELRSQRLIAFRPIRPALIETAITQRLGDSTERYEEAGVAAKGYNAIEYALYRPNAALTDAARCQWLQRNAAEIAEHTPRLLARWQQFVATLPHGTDASVPPAASRQAVEEVVNLTLAALNDMHKTLGRLEGTKPEQLPGWFSASGKRQLLAQFNLLEAVLLGEKPPGGFARLATRQHPALASTLRRQVFAVQTALRQLPAQLAQPDAPQRAEAAVVALGKLMDTLEGPLAQALDITLSFNESDGD